MTEQQSCTATWNALEDRVQQEKNFRQASAAIGSVDWESLPDFETIIAEARRINVLGLNTPTRYGGLGLTTRQICSLFTQFERIDTASGHSVGYYNTLGVLALLFGKAFELGGYLEGVARGRLLGSFCVTEPQGGSHMAGMREMARRVGGDWELTGTKRYIAHAQAAGYFLVCARSSEGFKILAVDARWPGVSVSRTWRPAYMQRIFVNEIEFDGVRVPDDHVLHDRKVLYDTMMLTRVYILAAKIGHIERCLDRLRQFVPFRIISTGLMSDNPSVRRRIRELEVGAEVCQALLDYALQQEARGGVAYDLAMAGKVVGVKLAMEASATLQSLFGARGLDPQTGIPAVADDVRVWTQMEGASEPLQHFLAANYLAHKPWMEEFTARYPECFAAIPSSISPNAQNVDMAALGEAVAWAIVQGCTRALGVATMHTDWLLERRRAACVDDFLGLEGYAARRHRRELTPVTA
jgi:acyl-CoA dehydrogenase